MKQVGMAVTGFVSQTKGMQIATASSHWKPRVGIHATTTPMAAPRAMPARRQDSRASNEPEKDDHEQGHGPEGEKPHAPALLVGQLGGLAAHAQDQGRFGRGGEDGPAPRRLAKGSEGVDLGSLGDPAQMHPSHVPVRPVEILQRPTPFRILAHHGILTDDFGPFGIHAYASRAIVDLHEGMASRLRTGRQMGRTSEPFQNGDDQVIPGAAELGPGNAGGLDGADSPLHLDGPFPRKASDGRGGRVFYLPRPLPMLQAPPEKEHAEYDQGQGNDEHDRKPPSSPSVLSGYYKFLSVRRDALAGPGEVE